MVRKLSSQNRLPRIDDSYLIIVSTGYLPPARVTYIFNEYYGNYLPKGNKQRIFEFIKITLLLQRQPSQEETAQFSMKL